MAEPKQDFDVADLARRTGPLDTLDLHAWDELRTPTWREHVAGWFGDALGLGNPFTLLIVASIQRSMAYWAVRLAHGAGVAGFTWRGRIGALSAFVCVLALVLEEEDIAAWSFGVALASLIWASRSKAYWTDRITKLSDYSQQRSAEGVTEGAAAEMASLGVFGLSLDAEPDAGETRRSSSQADPEFLGAGMVYGLLERDLYGADEAEIQEAIQRLPTEAQPLAEGWVQIYLAWLYRSRLRQAKGREFDDKVWASVKERCALADEEELVDLLQFWFDTLDAGQREWEEIGREKAEILEFPLEFMMGASFIKAESLLENDNAERRTDVAIDIAALLAVLRDGSASRMDGLLGGAELEQYRSVMGDTE